MPALDGCHWRPPDKDRFKLNVNAAWKTDGADIGGLIRDYLGRVRIPFTVVLSHSHSLEHVETVAIHEVLRLLKDLATLTIL